MLRGNRAAAIGVATLVGSYLVTNSLVEIPITANSVGRSPARGGTGSRFVSEDDENAGVSRPRF